MTFLSPALLTFVKIKNNGLLLNAGNDGFVFSPDV